MPASCSGQAVHGALAGCVRGGAFVRHAGTQHGVDDLAQMPFGNGWMAITIRDHLTLLGEPQTAGDGAARLCEDGTVRRAATATDGAAATVEDLHRDTGASAGVSQIALGAIQG